MWADFCKRWFDLCCWWVPKTGGMHEKGDEATRVQTTADNTPISVEAAKDLEEGNADDLTVIKGIGPAIRTKLKTFGVTSLADLAASDPEVLTARLKGSQPISAARVVGWIEAAEERVARET